MSTLIPLVRMTKKWDRFCFYNNEPLPYQVKLPDGRTWRLSPDVKYELIKNGSPLYSGAKAAMSSDGKTDPNTYDLSSSEFEAGEILAFFYMMTYAEINPGVILSHIKDEYLYNVVLLTSLYAPKLANNVFFSLVELLLLSIPSKENMYVWWDLVVLSQQVLKDSPLPKVLKNMRWLSFYPHSLYLHEKTVDLSRLPITGPIVEAWRVGDEPTLKKLEETHEGLVDVTRNGVEFIRIPNVAKTMGHSLNNTQALDCGSYVIQVYRERHGRAPTEVEFVINNRLMHIKHYTPDDYDVVVEGIERYLRK